MGHGLGWRHRRVMDVNYSSAVELIIHIVPDMVRRNSGTVVMVSTVQDRTTVPFRDACSEI